MNDPRGTLHVLWSLRAEGCPRLALEMLRQDNQEGRRPGAVVSLSPEHDDLLTDFLELGALHYSIPWSRRGYIGLATRLPALLGRLRPKGTICYTLGQHVSVGIAVAATVRSPVVLHLGTAPPEHLALRRKYKLQLLAGRPFTHRYAACSEHVRNESIRHYRLPSARVVTIPNGVPIERFLQLRAGLKKREERRTGGDRQSLTIGMVGSLEASKDQIVLVHATALLRARGVDAHLRLIGGGSSRASLGSLATRLGVGQAISFTGVVRDVPSELSQLDVFAYAVHPVEGMGLALVEALAAGLPVVASDVPATQEVLCGGQLGLLVAPSDAAAWADALERARFLPPPPIESLERYDIRQTARAYAQLLGN